MGKGKKKAQPVSQPPKRDDLAFSLGPDEFDIDTFSAGGPGGQHQNTSNTAVRITHKASGAVGESREHRSQTQNKKAALQRLTQTKKFEIWKQKKLMGNPLPAEQQVEKDMRPENLLIMGKNDEGQWRVID